MPSSDRLPLPSFPVALHHEGTPPRTLVERAYLGLRRDIVRGRLAPGERLRVEHLKDRYEVGAGTLREALARLVSDALVTVEGQRGFRVAPISLADLRDVTDTRVAMETEALRLSIRQGDAQWEADLSAAYERLAEAETREGGLRPEEWEQRNHAFHEALIAAHRSAWTHHFLGILYRHAERYRHIALRLAATQAAPRDVHREHEDIFRAAMARQEARAALALEAHVRMTHEMLRHATFGAGVDEEPGAPGVRLAAGMPG